MLCSKDSDKTISKTQDHYDYFCCDSIDNISKKLNGNELFNNKKKLTFSQNMIYYHKIYIFTENIKDQPLFCEIDDILKNKIIKFATFSFNIYQKKEYITIFLENYCYLIEIQENLLNSLLRIIFGQITKSPMHFISPNYSDYQRLEDLVNEINKKSIECDSMIIKLSNFIYSREKHEEINYDVRQIGQKIEIKIMKNPIFYLLKDSMLTFMIRRFYFKRKYFENSDFFDFASASDSFKLQEFQKEDFIEIRSIAINNFLVLYKKTNQLFVQKINVNLPKIEDFLRAFEMYERLNKTDKFIHCYGYTKNELNQIESLIFEFMSGGNLEEYILKSNSKKDNDHKLKISFEIIEGIYMLHSNEIIHRDLKPDNIFIDHESNFVIGDFDCSRIIDKSTVMTTDIGQIKYSSPEMRYSQKYSKSTDIYSYGLVLYFIFSEEHPFNELNDFDVLHIKDDHHLINMINKNINNEFIKSLSSKCIKFSKDERPTAEVILELFIDFFIKSFMDGKYKLLLYLLKKNDYFINEKIVSIYNDKYLIKQKNKLNQTNVFLIITRLLSLNSQGNSTKSISYIIHFLIKLSDKNNPKAQFVLGKIYSRDDFVPSDINKSIHYYTLSANQNEYKALYKLGIIYYMDKSIPRNINKAIHYFTLSSNQNNPFSQYILGIIYIEGKYVVRNVNKGILYFTLSANGNNPDSQHFLGLFYQGNSKTIKKSIYYFTIAANQNNPDSQYQLGLIYLAGHNVSIDIEKGIHYLTLSADNNQVEAQYNLGLFYYSGKYVKRDINKAIHYLTLSADNNHSDSQYVLGKIYKDYNNISIFDINKSIHYFTLSADMNNSDSLYELGLIYMNSFCIDIDKSIYYFTLASNQNDSNALMTLGLIYLNGYHVKKDNSKAFYYLNLSANLNNSFAQFYIGYEYIKGEIVKQVIQKAISYFTLSANQNNDKALFFLGFLYYNSGLVTKDIKKAIYYFTLSANLNNTESQFYLGYIYFSGYDVPKDINKSIYYFKLSADQNDSRSQLYLGIIYLYFYPISHDINKGLYYINLSANQNNNVALLYLGIFYYQGKFVSRDINKVFYYLNLSANLNNSVAQMYMGMFYLGNEYFPKDVHKAIYYLTNSANQNQVYAQYLLGLVYLHEIKNYNKAIYYLKLSASQLIVDANLLLGQIYFTNRYIKRDINKSIHHFKEASSFNNGNAKNNLGIIYQNGYEVVKNIYTSKEYFEEAIQQDNDVYSLYNLSRIYYFGKYNNIINVGKAIELLKKASKQKFLAADFFLFMIFSFGNMFIANNGKSDEHEQNIEKSRFSDIMTIFYLNPGKNYRIFMFIKDFDFFYVLLKDYEDIFFNHLKNVIIEDNYVVPDCLHENEDIEQTSRANSNIQEINELFYEGFGIM